MLLSTAKKKVVYLKDKIDSFNELILAKIRKLESDDIPLSRTRVVNMVNLVNDFATNMKEQLDLYISDGEDLINLEDNIKIAEQRKNCGVILSRCKRLLSPPEYDPLANELMSIAISGASEIGWNEFDGETDEDEPELIEHTLDHRRIYNELEIEERVTASNNGSIIEIFRELLQYYNPFGSSLARFVNHPNISRNIVLSLNSDLQERPELYNPSCNCNECIKWSLLLCHSYMQNHERQYSETQYLQYTCHYCRMCEEVIHFDSYSRNDNDGTSSHDSSHRLLDALRSFNAAS